MFSAVPPTFKKCLYWETRQLWFFLRFCTLFKAFASVLRRLYFCTWRKLASSMPILPFWQELLMKRLRSHFTEKTLWGGNRQNLFQLFRSQNFFDPFSVKLFAGIFCDSLSLPGLGRRKTWVLIGHTLMVVALMTFYWRFDDWVEAKNIFNICLIKLLLYSGAAIQGKMPSDLIGKDFRRHCWWVDSWATFSWKFTFCRAGSVTRY